MSLNPLEIVDTSCPYCGETLACSIDTSIEWQQYTEDCHVCCAPILLTVSIERDTETIQVQARPEND